MKRVDSDRDNGRDSDKDIDKGTNRDRDSDRDSYRERKRDKHTKTLALFTSSCCTFRSHAIQVYTP